MSNKQVFCTMEVCQHNEQKRCIAEAIHLEGCTPDADNVFACSEFCEKETMAGSLLRADSERSNNNE